MAGTNCVLIKITADYAEQIKEYRQEFLDAGDSMDGTGALRRTADPYEFIRTSIEREDPYNVPADRVPATQFLFIRKDDNRLLGMLQVRHCFNDYLEKYGGHIGYSIRPSERRRGYAKEMLKAATLTKSTSPQSLLVSGFLLTPTSITAAPSLTISALTNNGLPTAATNISA